MGATDQLKEYYERTAERFWDPAAGPIGRDLVVYRLLAGCRGSLLDYGCGAGSLLLHLAKEDRFRQVIGADISEAGLARLRTVIHQQPVQTRERIRLCQPQGDLLPEIASGSLETIVSVATIEHVMDPYVVLDELHRVAAPGATLICSVPNYRYIRHLLTLIAGELPRTGTDEPVKNWRRTGWDGMHIHTFTKSAFSTLLDDCGWRPTLWSGWGERLGWLVGLRRRFPGLWSGELFAVCTKK